MPLHKILMPPQVEYAIRTLQQAGFSAYIVGGCVRDALRGEIPHDWDLTTSAMPLQTKDCFRNETVIETGLKHGTVTVLKDGMPLEITTYRIDGAYTDHRRPDAVTFTRNLRDDLSRRDFTVNAMAYHPDEGIIDLFGGQEDLARQRIACVGNPSERFDEDGLRILRALRFSAVLDFKIAPDTAAAIHAQKELLTGISAERIFSELSKLLCGIGAQRILREYADVLFTILPDLAPMYRFDQQNPHHCYDVYEHTLRAISAVPPEPMLRFAALLHDSGKPSVFTKDERGGHFYGHAAVSTEIARNVLHRLKSDRKTLDTVCRLVEYHDLVFPTPVSEKHLKRVISKLGFDHTEALLLLHRADVSAQAESHRAERIAHSNALLDTLAKLRAADECLTIQKLAVTGNDLINLGVPQGKLIGTLLRTLLEQVIDGIIPNEPAALLNAAEQYLNQQKSG